MIRTFEELFGKLEAEGCNSHRLKGIYQSYLDWKDEHRKSSGTARTTALIHQGIYRNSLMGYLSCLQDTGYICQSEYDQLWNSLELPGIPEKGGTHDSNI